MCMRSCWRIKTPLILSKIVTCPADANAIRFSGGERPARPKRREPSISSLIKILVSNWGQVSTSASFGRCTRPSTHRSAETAVHMVSAPPGTGSSLPAPLWGR
eukprot:7439766-Pyramimonas_sp.AAC.1